MATLPSRTHGQCRCLTDCSLLECKFLKAGDLSVSSPVFSQYLEHRAHCRCSTDICGMNDLIATFFFFFFFSWAQGHKTSSSQTNLQEGPYEMKLTGLPSEPEKHPDPGSALWSQIFPSLWLGFLTSASWSCFDSAMYEMWYMANSFPWRLIDSNFLFIFSRKPNIIKAVRI